jgi:dTMP kinase
MKAGRLIAFEGVDGAGKSTALRHVANRLREQGVKIFLPRTGKEHASRPTRMIRQLTRDPRNYELSPLAELLLYCAREAQVMNELVRPALARGETVLMDRSSLTAVVLGMARGLSQDECQAAARLASSGVEPSLTLVFDVHPRTSRLRKRIERIRTHSLGGGGRKGLVGSAFKERVRDGYLQIAQARGYPLFRVERATPQELAARVVQVVQLGSAAAPNESALDAEPRWQVPEGQPFVRSLEAMPLAEALFFGEGLIAARHLRAAALALEPELTAYTLDEADPLREAAAEVEPDYALRGWYGKPLSEPDDLRLRLLPHASATGAALRALRGVADAQSDALREHYAGQEPSAALSSLAGRDDARAWQLRERLWDQADHDARAQTLIGCVNERSAELREQLFNTNPLLALESLRNTCSAQGDAWLTGARKHAPKLVLAALAGRQDEFAHRLRDELFETGREVIDTVRRLSDDASFALRERALPRWPSTVAHSLLSLEDSPRVRSLYERCRALGARDLHVLRRLTLLDEQPQLPSWVKQKRGLHPERDPTEQ